MVSLEVLEERIKALKEELENIKKWCENNFRTLYEKSDKKKGFTLLGSLKG